jgi:hypothetical protein
VIKPVLFSHQISSQQQQNGFSLEDKPLDSPIQLWGMSSFLLEAA